jgi:hypothetical protein
MSSCEPCVTEEEEEAHTPQRARAWARQEAECERE